MRFWATGNGPDNLRYSKLGGVQSRNNSHSALIPASAYLLQVAYKRTRTGGSKHMNDRTKGDKEKDVGC